MYQAPDEGGIHRYLAIFQAQDPPSIGPIRSTRLYFAGWAAEWHALLAYAGGSPNAIAFIDRLQGKQIWGPTTSRRPPRLVPCSGSPRAERRTTSTRRTRSCEHSSPGSARRRSPWTFREAAPRPTGDARRAVPGQHDHYQYDAAKNTYLRSVSREGPQIDAGNHRRVAPANVIVLYMPVGRLWNTGPDSSNERSGRLEVHEIGSGTATVFANGVAIAARLSKPNEILPTVFTYASRPGHTQARPARPRPDLRPGRRDRNEGAVEPGQPPAAAP